MSISDQKAYIKRFVQKIKVFKNCLNFDPKILIFIVICLILKKFLSTPWEGVKEAKIVKARDTPDAALYCWRFQRLA